MQRIVESLVRPHAARSHALVSECERLPIVARLVDDLGKELSRLVGLFVEADARKHHQRSGPLRARGQWDDQVTQLCLRAPRVAGLEVEVGSVHSASHGSFTHLCRGQLSGALEQECRRP